MMQELSQGKKLNLVKYEIYVLCIINVLLIEVLSTDWTGHFYERGMFTVSIIKALSICI